MTGAPPNAGPSDATSPLACLLRKAPKLSRTRVARQRVAEFLADVAAPRAAFWDDKPPRALLEGLADHSPFLWRLASVDADRLARLMTTPPAQSLDRLLAIMNEASQSASGDEQIMRALRKGKQEAALLIALADIGGVWDLADATRALTRFADAAVSDALGFLLRRERDAGKLRPVGLSNPWEDCGMVVLALGKHGAGELNYSSDIDIVVLFDRAAAALERDVEPAALFVRITRALARLLQERTGDGYVLRVDLRLRPDPGSTAVAISLDAAMDYYETVGQNWERAAMIKARPVAGDLALGEGFLRSLAPFIWRKYFDYAAIADIHAMKRQIHAVRGHADVAVAGHDVKLGRGGIREIEFFAQTQQLIFGGKRLRLRGARTLDTLAELARDGWIKPAAAQELTQAYVFLREIEHRLQMLHDEQTQRLPLDDAELERFARFCGFSGAAMFSRRLLKHLRAVERHYARLFESAPGLDTALGSLVFTGTADDPETLVTLRKLGFHDPSRAAETVRGWHFGRRPAVQSPRAREVLTELVPGLLEAFAGSGDPDAALAAFDAALARMPAAIELMSLLRSNKNLRELFADILGGAPRLANVVAMRPHVLDAAIDPAFGAAGRDERVFQARAKHLLESAGTTEDFLDGARDMAQEEKFLIGVRMLSEAIDPARAGRGFSALADALIEAALAHTQAAFKAEHGEVASGRCVVLGMGKLGSREMTAASDLDLIVIYEYNDAHPDSRGGRPLHAARYYTRLTQRLVSALTVATRRGGLYEVDMRLRPSGNKGPVATRFSAFLDYQKSEAETWERMALTRARVVCGDASLARDMSRALTRVLTAPRDGETLRREVYDMRRLMAREKGEDDPWDLKLAAGGLIDLEFLAQYFVLRHGAAHRRLLRLDTQATLAAATRLGLLPERDGEVLRGAHRLLSAVTQMLRLAVEGPFDPAATPSGALRRVAAVSGLPDFRSLERELVSTRGAVRAVFQRVLGEP